MRAMVAALRFFRACREQVSEASDLERALDVGQLVTCQRQVALILVQHQVQEQARDVGHQADQVVLVCEGDEDVFNALRRPRLSIVFSLACTTCALLAAARSRFMPLPAWARHMPLR